MPAAADSHASASTASDAPPRRSACGSSSPARAAPIDDVGRGRVLATARGRASAPSRCQRPLDVGEIEIHPAMTLPRPRRHEGTDQLYRLRPSLSKIGCEPRRRSAARSSGSTRVSPTTVMKLVSPFQRGTRCTCTCSSTPAPGRLAEIDADVDALRLVGLASARFSHSCVRSRHLVQLVGVSDASDGRVPVRHHHQVAVVVGIEIEDDVAGRAVRRRSSGVGGVGGRRRVAEDAPRVGLLPVTYSSRQGDQRRSIES